MRKALHMSTEALQLLGSFEALSEADQIAFTAEILKRSAEWDYASPDDADLVALADETFLELDRREAGEDVE